MTEKRLFGEPNTLRKSNPNQIFKHFANAVTLFGKKLPNLFFRDRAQIALDWNDWSKRPNIIHLQKLTKFVLAPGFHLTVLRD